MKEKTTGAKRRKYNTSIQEAFKKALMKRSISAAGELIVHSDRGGQYAGNKFRKLLHSNHKCCRAQAGLTGE